MSDTFKRYATPFITGLFLVSLVSGVALFFHFGGAAFRGMHEWLSMVLIVPFVLHLWKNWRAMTTYFGRAPLTVAAAISLVAALAFAWPAMTGAASGRAGGPPPFALTQTLLKQPAAAVAPALGTTAEALVATLKDKGFTAASADMPLSDVATQSGKDVMEMAAALVAAAK